MSNRQKEGYFRSRQNSIKPKFSFKIVFTFPLKFSITLQSDKSPVCLDLVFSTLGDFFFCILSLFSLDKVLRECFADLVFLKSESFLDGFFSLECFFSAGFLGLQSLELL